MRYRGIPLIATCLHLILEQLYSREREVIVSRTWVRSWLALVEIYFFSKNLFIPISRHDPINQFLSLSISIIYKKNIIDGLTLYIGTRLYICSQLLCYVICWLLIIYLSLVQYKLIFISLPFRRSTVHAGLDSFYIILDTICKYFCSSFIISVFYRLFLL